MEVDLIPQSPVSREGGKRPNLLVEVNLSRSPGAVSTKGSCFSFFNSAFQKVLNTPLSSIKSFGVKHLDITGYSRVAFAVSC